jgi:hypothetical protein
MQARTGSENHFRRLSLTRALDPLAQIKLYS